MDRAERSAEFRKTLTEIVKLAGEEVYERAEDIVGQGELLSSLEIIIRIAQPVEMPTIDVNKTYICRKALDAKVAGKI